VSAPKIQGTDVPIYENLVIGNFLYALGLKIGARRHDYIAPDLAVNLLQQTPLDRVLGDVLLIGPRAVALLEFKRAADRRSKEQDKLELIEAILERPKFQELRTISQQIHFYVETKDILKKDFSFETGDTLNNDFSQVLPYLDLRTDDQGSKLEQLIDLLAFRATSAPELWKTRREACQRYLELVCICQGRFYDPSPGLLVAVGADGGTAFAPLDDLRDLRTIFAEIQLRQDLRLRQEFRLRQELRLEQDLRLREELVRRQELRLQQDLRLRQRLVLR
jgi:hypothetical protein